MSSRIFIISSTTSVSIKMGTIHRMETYWFTKETYTDVISALYRARVTSWWNDHLRRRM